MNLRASFVGAVAAALVCTSCGSSDDDSASPVRSDPPATSSASGSTSVPTGPGSAGPSDPGTHASPLAKSATFYTPRIRNACGIVSDGDAAFPIGCSSDDAATLKFGATNSLAIPDGTGILTPGGAFLIGGKILLPIRTGQPTSVKGAILEIDTASGKTSEVDLGDRIPSASAIDADDVIVGTRAGEVLAIPSQGKVTVMGSVGSPIAGVAADSRNIWVVEESGSVDWLPPTGGQSRQIGTAKAFQREGIAAIGGTLWVLTRQGKIRRFRALGETNPVKVSKAVLSLTSCSGGVWVRERSTRSDTSDYVVLSHSGKSVGSWNPPAFTAYSACAGSSGVWGLTVDGLLYRSPT